ncbi:MAG: LacI family transcriptional regulator [Actinobacteria bacterium]|nr:LacI family transcriptional regulator [Actinomycetota bacterium]
MVNRITLKDVAIKANTSIRTVSRVINSSNLVNSKTREKVLEVINELNYKPNIIARSLKSKSSKSIGVIVLDVYSPFFSPIIRAIESIARRNNYSVIICESQYDFEIEKQHLETLMNRMVDGIIINPATKDYKYLQSIAEMGVNIAVLGDVETFHIDAVSVHIDDYKGMSMAVQFLINNGHKKIVFINGDVNVLNRDTRLSGYKDTLEKNKIKFKNEIVFDAKVYIEGGYEVAKKIFNTNYDFTAIMCFNDLIAMGILKYCNENNIRIPEDYSIVGFDDIFCAPLLNPPLTTIHQQKTLIGEKIGELLFHKINNEEIKESHIKLTPTLVIRKSVKRIN